MERKNFTNELRQIALFVSWILITVVDVTAQDPLPAICGMHEMPLIDDPIDDPEPPYSGHYCTYSPNTSIYSDLSRYTPDKKSLNVRVNFIILQRQDGTGNFQDIPEHREFLDDWLDNCNDLFGNSWWSSIPGCLPPSNESSIRIVPNWIFLPDTSSNQYYWNNLNSNTIYGCPNYSNWWLNGLDQIINNDPLIPRGINIYFTIDGGIYNQMVVLQTIDNPQTAGMSYVWCSEHPSLDDLNKPLRIHVPNLFLKYYWFKEIESTVAAPFSVSRDWLVNEGRVLAHELGHSFIREYVHYNGCIDHFMHSSGNSNSRSMRTTDVQYMHRGFIYNNVRQYIDCDERYDSTIYTLEREWNITQDEEWVSDMRIYHNLRVSAGATLTIRCNLLLPKDGIVIVERGGRLIVDGGRVRRANTCGKDEHWAGIAVQGNPVAMQPAPNGILTSSDGGVIILKSGGEIEGAEIGVIAQTHPHWDVPTDRGGLIQVDSFTFRNNVRGVHFTRYDFPNFSFFKRANFLNNNGNAKWGVTMWRTNNILFEGCLFQNLTRNGIESWDASYNIYRRNRFINCAQIGIVASGSMPLAGHVVVGNSLNSGSDQNRFINNTVGFRGTANVLTEIRRNHMENFEFDVAISGKSNNLVFSNYLGADAAGIQFESSGNHNNRAECNIYKSDLVGINIIGDNQSMIFNKEKFNSKHHDLFIEGMAGNPGRILEFQGGTNNARLNYFTLGKPQQIKTSTVSPWNNTLHFHYFHPQVTAALPNVLPLCALNHVCTPSSNFSIYETSISDYSCNDIVPFYDENIDISYLYTIRDSISLLTEHNYEDGQEPEDLQRLIAERELIISGMLIGYVNSQNWEAAEDLIRNDISPDNIRRQVALALWRDDFILADSLLDAFPDEELEDRQFIEIQRINSAFLSDKDFVLTELQGSTLYEIAVSGTTEAGYAQSLLSLLTGETIMPRLPIIEEYSMAFIDISQGSGSMNSELSVYPNPAINRVSVLWNNKKEEMADNADICVVELISGKSVFSGRINRGEHRDLDVSAWVSGIYLIKVNDMNTGQLLVAQKLLIAR